MLDNIGGSGSLLNPGPERLQPNLAINAPDPVLGQPVEQELKVDTQIIQERADQLSLGNAANTIEVQRGVRNNEALEELRNAGEDLASLLAERRENLQKAEAITPRGSIVEKPSVQPTLEVISQELNNVIDTESIVFNDVLDQEGTFFSIGVPDLTIPENEAGEEVVSEALAQVETFINSINQEITENRTVVVNVGNQAAAPENQIQPLTDERQAQQVRQEVVQQVREQAEVAFETQANLSNGTLLELYNS